MVSPLVLLVALPTAQAGDDLSTVAQALQALADAQQPADCDPGTRLELYLPSARGAQGEALAVDVLRRAGAWLVQSPNTCPPTHGILPHLEPAEWAAVDADMAALLDGGGYGEAARTWAALAKRARAGLAEAPTSERDCRCMGERVRGTPIVYGYPTRRAIRSSRLGRIELGGCIIDMDSPWLSCPQGCAPAGTLSEKE